MPLCELLHKPSLAERTTLGIGGYALAELRVLAEEGIAEVRGLLKALGGRPVVLGAGSNILAADGEMPLVLLSLQHHEEPRIIREEEDHVYVQVSAGQRLPVLLSKLAAMGASGLAGLSGIPGTVGGAIAMNAGSYGHTMGAVLDSINVLMADGTVRNVPRQDIELGYRHMSLAASEKDGIARFMVLSAVLRMERKEPTAIREAMRAYMSQKQQTQPVTAKSAGCVFKNPSPENPAGKLLDEAGMKGRRLGGMAFSPMHANFLINEGNGSSGAAMDLLDMARETVLNQFGIHLELEVMVWRS